MTRPGVLVVGSITADVTAFAQRLPLPGETVLGTDATIVLGGKGANQAVAAARFGVDTWMVGCVGRDSLATLTLEGLARHGVSTDFIQQVDAPTGIAHIRVDGRGQNDIVIAPLANAQLSAADVDAALAALAGSVQVLLLQLEIPEAVTVYAAAAGKRAGLTVIFDPAPAAPIETHAWKSLDVVTPNESEASRLTGISVTDSATAAAAADWFIQRGVRDVVVTMGSEGALVVNNEGSKSFYPAHQVESVDSTAAGDAFTGTLGSALSQGMSLDEAMRYAMAAGALTVTKRGASPSLPTAQEVHALAETSRPSRRFTR
jgi:ribokinase